MRALELHQAGTPLRLIERDKPQPGPGCVLLRVAACGVCRTDLHIIDGGYADYAVADARYCFPIQPQYGDAEAAPLLCAGLIGYRAYAMALAMTIAGDTKTLGIYGFNAAAHILAQVAVADGRTVYAFTRRGVLPCRHAH